MNKKCNITKEELEKMCKKKMTNKQIATELGVSISSINGYKKRFQLSHKYKNNEIYLSKKQIQNCFERDLLQAEAAKELKCNISTFRKFCKLYQIKFKGNVKDNSPDNRRIVLHYYKRGAAVRNLQFELDENYFYELIIKHCVYCNDVGRNVIPQKYFKEQSKSSFSYTGIDRVDSSKGYTKENSVPCCSICNRAKSNMSEYEFKQWIERLTKFNHNR